LPASLPARTTPVAGLWLGGTPAFLGRGSGYLLLCHWISSPRARTASGRSGFPLDLAARRTRNLPRTRYPLSFPSLQDPNGRRNPFIRPPKGDPSPSPTHARGPPASRRQ